MNIIISACLLTIVFACVTKKSAVELSKIKYSKISKEKNLLISKKGTYISKDTLFSLDEQLDNEVSTDLIRFNDNRTVQISRGLISENKNIAVTNENLIDFISNITSHYYYYFKGKNKLIIERYEGKSYDASFYALGGPRNGAYVVSEKFEIRGDTLFNMEKYKTNFKQMYILNKKLIENHSELKANW